MLPLSCTTTCSTTPPPGAHRLRVHLFTICCQAPSHRLRLTSRAEPLFTNRRGLRALNIEVGNKLAILAGDFLLARASVRLFRSCLAHTN